MGSPPRIRFYLVHQETGQRYPLCDHEVVIGRTSGEIVFQTDPRLSPQHCLVDPRPAGVNVRDLGSAFGTQIDAKVLDPGKVYPLLPGNVLIAGQQVFKLHEASVPKRIQSRTRTRKPNSGKPRTAKRFEWHYLLMIALAVLAVFVVLKETPLHRIFLRARARLSLPPAARSSNPDPYARMEQEIQSVIENYIHFHRHYDARAISGREATLRLRQHLIPAFKGALKQLSSLPPRDEWEKQKMEIIHKLLQAHKAQAESLAQLAETRDPKYAVEFEALRERIHELTGEFSRFRRQPAQTSPHIESKNSTE